MTQQRGRAANGRSSIHRDAEGRWHGWVSMGQSLDGKAVRRHVSGRTRSAVTQRVRLLEQQRDAGAGAVCGRPPTIDTYLSQWITRREALGVRPSTVAGYRTDTRYVRASIGGLRIDRVTPGDIERLWANMRDAGVVGSIGHCRRTLRACLADAVHDGFLARNPVALARVPKYESPPIEPYSTEEVRQFIRAAGSEPNGVRWVLGAVLGLRQGEVLGLEWHDLDADAQVLTIQRQLRRQTWRHGCADQKVCSKRGADCPTRSGGGLVVSEPKSRAGRRRIELPLQIVDDLAAHRRQQLAERMAAEVWVPGDWVFSNPWGGPIDPRRDWSAFKAIVGRAGLRPIRLHDLRHSAATLMLEGNLDLRTAGSILGHSNSNQTAQYTHVLRDRRRAAAGKLQSLVWGTVAGE